MIVQQKICSCCYSWKEKEIPSLTIEKRYLLRTLCVVWVNLFGAQIYKTLKEKWPLHRIFALSFIVSCSLRFFVYAVPINMENKNTKMFSSWACTVFSFHKYPSKIHIHEVREVENIIFLPWQYKYPLGNISREIVRFVCYIASYLLYPKAVTASYRYIQRPFLSVCY